MHSAPSVTYPVGRSFWAGAAMAVVWALGLVVSALWSWQLAGPGWRMALAWLACAATGAAAVTAWWRSPAGRLHGSDGAWQWAPAQGPALDGSVRVALDLQHLLLLRLSSQGGAAVWLWLERRSAPAHWAALRRAVYSRANPGGLLDPAPPSATP